MTAPIYVLTSDSPGHAAALAEPLRGPFVWRCGGCGKTLALKSYGGLPIPLFVAIGEAFGRDHTRCKDQP